MYVYNDTFVEVLDVLKSRASDHINEKISNIDLNQDNIITYNGDKVYVYLDGSTIKFSTVERSNP